MMTKTIYANISIICIASFLHYMGNLTMNDTFYFAFYSSSYLALCNAKIYDDNEYYFIPVSMVLFIIALFTCPEVLIVLFVLGLNTYYTLYLKNGGIQKPKENPKKQDMPIDIQISYEYLSLKKDCKDFELLNISITLLRCFEQFSVQLATSRISYDTYLHCMENMSKDMESILALMDGNKNHSDDREVIQRLLSITRKEIEVC